MPPRPPEPPYLDPPLGVVFDLDGTLVASDHDFLRMRREVIRIAEKAGVPPGTLDPSQTIAQLIDTATCELARGRGEGAGFRFEGDVNHAIDAIELEALPRTTARAGAETLLQRLGSRGYRVGVLTRSSEPFARAALAHTGLAPLISHLRARTAAGPTKPDPEALLMLLREMEVPPDRAIYVGDHLLDATCATRARVRFFGILADPPLKTGPITRDRLVAAGASQVADDIFELSAHLGVAIPRPSEAAVA